ncbi:MAG: hypothetical protein VX625_00585, partial [Candidatus Thermoplasmatota archaeon]|nr:hypothetical protein [Candidatus Thermoplasmatota archaeon]
GASPPDSPLGLFNDFPKTSILSIRKNTFTFTIVVFTVRLQFIETSLARYMNTTGVFHLLQFSSCQWPTTKRFIFCTKHVSSSHRYNFS